MKIKSICSEVRKGYTKKISVVPKFKRGNKNKT